MLENPQNHLWELIWEYDPNGLVVLDRQMVVKLVNPAFCQMFGVAADAAIGQPARQFLGPTQIFERVLESGEVIRDRQRHYSHYELYVRQVIFPIPAEDLVACIVVDMTAEWKRLQEIRTLKTETIAQVNEVVDNQMKVVQEIAGLLGETTADTKVSLLKIVRAIEQEIQAVEDGDS